MLPRRRRVSKEDFSALLPESQSFGTPGMHLRVTPLSLVGKHGPSQFAFVASKKAAKTAVARHKLKRRGYAAVAKHLSEVKDGYALVFFFGKNTAGTSQDEIHRQLHTLLKKSSLII